MLTLIIGGIAAVVLYCTAANGEWGAFAVTAVILIFLILMAAGDRADSRAHINFRDYWARGGHWRRDR